MAGENMTWSVSHVKVDGKPLTAHAWVPNPRDPMRYLAPICATTRLMRVVDSSFLMLHTGAKNRRCQKCMKIYTQTVSYNDITSLVDGFQGRVRVQKRNTTIVDICVALDEVQGMLDSFKDAESYRTIQAWLYGSRLRPEQISEALKRGLEDVGLAKQRTVPAGINQTVTFGKKSTVPTVRAWLEALSVSFDGALERGIPMIGNGPPGSAILSQMSITP